MDSTSRSSAANESSHTTEGYDVPAEPQSRMTENFVGSLARNHACGAAVRRGEKMDASGAGSEAAHSTAVARSMPTARKVSQPTAFDRWLVRSILLSFGNPDVTVILWNGESIHDGGPNAARVRIKDRRTLLKIVFLGDLGFGDAYSDGDVEIEGSLVEFFCAVNRTSSTQINGNKDKQLGRLAALVARSGNSIPAARKRIHHHYDLGNDFYRLWLDREMVYTCGYFPSDEITLEEAQRAKMEYICRKLRLQVGETVFEAGSGWGGLALYMARRYGVRVRAYNISREQIAYARSRAAHEGLEHLVEFVEADYRHIEGVCDVFVSVGMLEHVGTTYYPAFGKVIDRCLSPRGRGFIHAIGRNRPERLDPWITHRIFPGAYPPSLRELLALLEPWAFSILDVENLRRHYARTLEHWLRRFEAAATEIVSTYDERFARMWRMYLAASQAAFETGALELFQVVFARPGANVLPATRNDVYELPLIGPTSADESTG